MDNQINMFFVMDGITQRCIIQSIKNNTYFTKWLEEGRWFSPDTPVSSTNKTDRHDIIDELLKVALNKKP